MLKLVAQSMRGVPANKRPTFDVFQISAYLSIYMTDWLENIRIWLEVRGVLSKVSKTKKAFWTRLL